MGDGIVAMVNKVTRLVPRPTIRSSPPPARLLPTVLRPLRQFARQAPRRAKPALRYTWPDESWTRVPAPTRASPSIRRRPAHGPGAIAPDFGDAPAGYCADARPE